MAPSFYVQRFVLLCEADAAVRGVFQRVFSRHPEFLLDACDNVGDAVTKVHTFSYDVAFIGPAGMELLRELSRLIIKVRSEFRGVLQTFVVIMGSDVAELQRVQAEAQALGVLAFIQRPEPFTEDYLTHIVQRLGFPILPPHTL